MRVGEIWEYKGKDEEFEDSFVVTDSDNFLKTDRLVKIITILKPSDYEVFELNADGENMELLKDITSNDMIEFEHLESRAIGLLPIQEFVRLYKKVYNEKTL